jgi:hypothetical protein
MAKYYGLNTMSRIYKAVNDFNYYYLFTKINVFDLYLLSCQRFVDIL